MIDGFIPPIKWNDRAASGHFYILLLAIAHIHFVLLPFMRIHIRATHTFIQASDNTLLLILIGLAHIVDAVHKDHNAGHGILNGHVADRHFSARRFRHALYTCRHHLRIKGIVTHLAKSPFSFRPFQSYPITASFLHRL